ncbi:MAG: Tim44 domain-containing protein [Rubrivivax sp.]|nr:Tim44 domain-containing protein [Rubrivivax sp.]
MKTSWSIAGAFALLLASAVAMAPIDADAKRLGGGKSTGTQRSMPERTAPQSTPATPAQQPGTPGQQAAAPAAAPGATPAAAPARSSWMGPLAGLAAGLGLAALASHFGFGEALANFMLIALLVVAGLALFAFLRRRMAGGGSPAQLRQEPAFARAGLPGSGQGSGQGSGAAAARVAWPAAAAPTSPTVTPATTEPAAGAAALPAAFVPAAFDSESFERIAKAIFIRMQAANDSANLDDLRQFTTPEMFAELKVDLLERGSATQATEVKSVEAKVVDVAEEGERQVVSVRYRGEVVEAAGATPEKFDEVWHLVRPRGNASAGWAIAGIEQMTRAH